MHEEFRSANVFFEDIKGIVIGKKTLGNLLLQINRLLQLIFTALVISMRVFVVLRLNEVIAELMVNGFIFLANLAHKFYLGNLLRNSNSICFFAFFNE